jgi:peptidoglycan/xylan/chitin deacetylase (PgdA/CDA1 family)
MPAINKCFLFSVDMEDVRLQIPDGNSYKEGVPVNTYKYLDWLQKNKSVCTFFITGSVAKLYPSLIREISEEGHELACHTYDHIPIDRKTPDEFRKDLESNINILMQCGATKIEGFRPPVYSDTPQTTRVYPILSEMGFS